MDKPQQKKITDVNPMLGALTFLGSLRTYAEDKKKLDETAMTDKFNDITVDTCCTPDTGLWETAVSRKNIEGKWVIVSQHDSKEEAEREHQKWIAYLKENPDCELKDIDCWNLEQLKQSEG